LIEKETIPEQEDLASRMGDLSEAPALVVAWSREEPWRIGQSLSVPAGNPGPVVVFGRGPRAGEARSKILLEEHRPAGPGATPPLASEAVSRSQLEIQALGTERLLVRNVGRCALLRNGEPVARAEFSSGDTLQLGRQLLFVLAPKTGMPGSANGYPDFAFGEPDPFGIVGESAAIWRLRAQIALLAPRPGHLLISGTSGSGKELVSQALHALSKRKDRRLVARNAATLPETLVDAELFGNARNYPNPGMADRAGLVGEANGSTLFLDEIAELSHASQAHLLRVLDGGEYHRLGEGTSRRSDFRLFGATNRDVSSLKHDLAARLTLRLHVPDLDARRQDVPLIVRHILRRAAANGDDFAQSLLANEQRAGQPSLDLSLIRALLEHRYTLGVREVESLLWRHLNAAQLNFEPQQGGRSEHTGEQPSMSAGPPDPIEADDSPSPESIQRCLDENNGVLELTWRALGLKNRFVLVRLIKKYGLEVRKRPGNAPPRGSASS
jgi:two-component system nitrogen regulation response regulator GlnG/two-component system response regulator HydG